MSIRVSKKLIPSDILEQSKKKCKVRLPPPMVGRKIPTFLTCWGESENFYYFPKRFDAELEQYLAPEYKFKKIEAKVPHRTLFDGNDMQDVPADCRRDQLQVFQEALSKMAEQGSTILHASTSFGKTEICVQIVCTKILLATAVMCHSLSVRDQWAAAFRKMGYEVQTTGEPSATCDIYINTPGKFATLSRQSLSKFGFLIVDEIQSCANTTLSKSMLNLCPRFLIGCSATPDTKNGSDKAFPLYYGHKDTWIKRILKKTFDVYSITTDFTVEVEKNMMGITPHIEVMKAYYQIPEFHELIFNVSQKTGDLRGMIMFALREEGLDIFRKYLDDIGYTDYAYYSGKEKTYDKTTKLLITTDKKCGYGFDDEGIKWLAFVHDTNDIRQHEGRARGNNYFIFDFHHPRRNQDAHKRNRNKWFLERGGTVKVISHHDIDEINLSPSEKVVPEAEE